MSNIALPNSAPPKRYKIGDLVWARLKGFPVWPGKIIEAKPEVKKPKVLKIQHFVFFFGSENYAYVAIDNIWPYVSNKNNFKFKKIPHGMKEALVAVENELSSLPEPPCEPEDLDSSDLDIFPSPMKTSGRLTTPKSSTRKFGEKDSGNDDGSTIEDSVSANGSVNESSIYTFDAAEEDKIAVPKPIRKKPLLTFGVKRSNTRKRMLGHSGFSGISFPSKKARMKQVSLKYAGRRSGGMDDAWTSVRMRTDAADASMRPELPDIGFVIKTPLSKEITPTKSRIGFLGLGIMGHGMVTNLLRSGHEVTVWNRTQDKCSQFVMHGAFQGNSPADVVTRCDITFCSLSDPTAVKEVVFGEEGVLEGMTAGKGFVDLSTVDLETVVDVNEAITMKDGFYLEAPVLGSKDQAMNGQLVLLGAGSRTLYQQCSSCFDALAKYSFYMGEAGCGCRTKLVYSMLIGTWTCALSESLALAQKSNVDLAILTQLLEGGALACPLLKVKGRAMREGKYTPHFPLQHMQKDLRLSLNMADQNLQSLPVSAAANETFKLARYLGFGNHDMSAIHKAVDM